MAKSVLDGTGLAKLWTLIKSKLGSYLPLAGGTMKAGAEVTFSPSATSSSSGAAAFEYRTVKIGGDAVTVSGTQLSSSGSAKLTTGGLAFDSGNIVTDSDSLVSYGSYGPMGMSYGPSSAKRVALGDSSAEFNVPVSMAKTLDVTGSATFGGDVNVAAGDVEIAGGDLTVGGDVNVTAGNITTASIMDISGEGGVSISSGSGGIDIAADGGDVSISANGTVNVGDLAVSGSAEFTGSVLAPTLTLNALTAAQLQAIATALFDFSSGSYYGAKLVSYDAANKAATIMFYIQCDNPMTPLRVKESCSGNPVGYILPRATSPYIGAITLAVPLDSSLEFDGSYNYVVDTY